MTSPADTAADLIDAAVRSEQEAAAKSLATIEPDQQQFTEQQVAILRQLGIEDATQGDLDLFFHYCRSTGLDPFRRQIYMIGRNTKVVEWVDNASGEGRRKVERFVTKYTIQTGIDGYRRNGREAAKALRDELRFEGPFFTGVDDFHVAEDGEVIQHWRKVWPAGSPPHAARFVIYRNGEEFEGIAHYDEFVQTNFDGKPNSMWSKMPRNQIAKCAEALAWRRAYPDDFSGLVLEDTAQPTVIDQDGNVEREGRQTRRTASAPVTAADILNDEPAASGDEAQQPELSADDLAADDGVAPEPVPAGEVSSDSGGDCEATAEADHPAATAERAESSTTPPAGTAAPAPEPGPAPEPEPAPEKKWKTQTRKALEKRLFKLLGAADIQVENREDRLIIYRFIVGRNDVTSTDDLNDVEVAKVCDSLYEWSRTKVLNDKITEILNTATIAEDDN